MPDIASAPPRGLLGALRREDGKAALIAVTAFLALVSLTFLLVPGLDIATSRLFYAGPSGFLDHRYPLIQMVREGGRIAEWAFALAVTAPLLLKILLPRIPLLVRPRASLFVIASLALGPGLLVNGILKELWGRARPREIQHFGGDAEFTPVWWITDQCSGNCSFVSGEAAGAFWLLALVFVVPRRWRPAAAAAALPTAAAVSFARLAAGAHFLSDVLLAWLLTLLVILALRRLVLQGLPQGFDAAVEDGLARAGTWLRRPALPQRRSSSP